MTRISVELCCGHGQSPRSGSLRLLLREVLSKVPTAVRKAKHSLPPAPSVNALVVFLRPQKKMVRILANGDIVQDDDPRVRKTPPRREELNRGRQGFIHNTEHTNQPFQGPANQGHSLFADLNQRLIHMGFPRWNLGNQVIEPIMSILLLLMLMLFGMRGLVLIGGLYLFSQFSQR
ncbi:uncharacterized protein FAM241A [Mobula birostris]|uniref:uncharacterized protein FAM241A n=1 Tax=Mobula birostris TaxID=1983395 RepID=UPI003B27CC78